MLWKPSAHHLRHITMAHRVREAKDSRSLLTSAIQCSVVSKKYIYIGDTIACMERAKIEPSYQKKLIFILTPMLTGGSIESIITYLPEDSIDKYKVYIVSADTKDGEKIKKKYKFINLLNLSIYSIYRKYIVMFESIAILKILWFPILFL
jgi:hypothetical protein